MKDLLKGDLMNQTDAERPRLFPVCSLCGKTWTAPPDGQKGAGNDHDPVREQTVEKAMQEFQFCPICGHTVCTRCLITRGDLTMCRACAKELNRYEEPIKR